MPSMSLSEHLPLDPDLKVMSRKPILNNSFPTISRLVLNHLKPKKTATQKHKKQRSSPRTATEQLEQHKINHHTRIDRLCTNCGAGPKNVVHPCWITHPWKSDLYAQKTKAQKRALPKHTGSVPHFSRRRISLHRITMYRTWR